MEYSLIDIMRRGGSRLRESGFFRVKGYVNVINLTRCQINPRVEIRKANAKLQMSSTFPRLRGNMAIVPGRGYLILQGIYIHSFNRGRGYRLGS